VPPKIPTRTDAYIECVCGSTMSIATVAPIPDKPAHMRHTYSCADCSADATFDVEKKAAATK
jgi:hypothetical protein